MGFQHPSQGVVRPHFLLLLHIARFRPFPQRDQYLLCVQFLDGHFRMGQLCANSSCATKLIEQCLSIEVQPVGSPCLLAQVHGCGAEIMYVHSRIAEALLLDEPHHRLARQEMVESKTDVARVERDLACNRHGQFLDVFGAVLLQMLCG
ncbi:hypothetical protein BO221_20825 [Archangium sp. Cb G35]|nr:hypothetical protein BO221_20825 [Archangium sp. Cb G35]